MSAFQANETPNQAAPNRGPSLYLASSAMAALTVSFVPALISLAFLWWNGHLAWMCWVVAFVSVIAYSCARFTLFWRDGLKRAYYTDVQAFRGWELVGSLALWAQWIVCALAIILALFLRHT